MAQKCDHPDVYQQQLATSIVMPLETTSEASLTSKDNVRIPYLTTKYFTWPYSIQFWCHAKCDHLDVYQHQFATSMVVALETTSEASLTSKDTFRPPYLLTKYFYLALFHPVLMPCQMRLPGCLPHQFATGMVVALKVISEASLTTKDTFLKPQLTTEKI